MEATEVVGCVDATGGVMVPYRLLSVREPANLGTETAPLSAASSQLPFFPTLESRRLALQIARLPSGVSLRESAQ